MSMKSLDAAYRLTGIGGSEKTVLVNLAYRADATDHIAWPSKQRIAKDTSLSVRTVDRAIKSLEAKGLVKIQPRRRPNGSHGSHRYLLTFMHEQNQEARSSESGDPVAGAGGIPSTQRELPCTMTALEPIIEPTNTNHNSNGNLEGVGAAGDDKVKDTAESVVTGSSAQGDENACETVQQFRLRVPEKLLRSATYLQIEKALLLRGCLYTQSVDSVLDIIQCVLQEVGRGDCDESEVVGRVIHRTKPFALESMQVTASKHPVFDLDEALLQRQAIKDRQAEKEVRKAWDELAAYAEEFHQEVKQGRSPLMLSPRCWMYPAFHTLTCFQILWTILHPEKSYMSRGHGLSGFEDYILRAKKELAGDQGRAIRQVCGEHGVDIDAWLEKNSGEDLASLVPINQQCMWWPEQTGHAQVGAKL